ncbi:helix-turn-helix transcriptional regulator [Mycobacterium shimoidei]|uniref:Transcriptional regulator [Saccharopolyspora erythraea NRRL 2338] n=1 Tax=Mycobacterium shimoidei TaxID=29313 RepID=A0A1E3TI16_MYCSH|nr:helix-turn-helix domain-containing protein [Mycobacterium shimoidei]MCV7257495.1 helix-turn-helix domain-containing protein [Mycobacterium shimoidei]ODR13970.1 ArsR family transcriptional regulator [Mycobacterium shimoidei]ORW82560.1 ArsR family transcriptional regulator [Mycobacterium shimoidei]SRX94174.1 transcriptional regulator [Saccharopolyspora erythraea NRRL 2338] [Mycobacterium shimoidei]
MDIGVGGGLDAVAGLSSLDDPARRRLYEYVASRDKPVARDEAATAVGISRTLAAYHLDKLADAGILAVSYARPPGRSGPGAGRPTKRYTRTQQELSASVPPRNYGLLARLLAQAVTADTSGAVASAVAAAARKAGRTSAGDGGVIDSLCGSGYEPARTAAGDIELRNCPFHQLMREYPELVCGLNLELIQGMLEARGERPSRAVLAPREDRCCVVVRAAQRRAKTRPVHRSKAK